MKHATLAQTKNKIAGIQWYKQSAATKFFYMMFPWVTAHEPTIFHRPAGVTFQGIMCGIQEGFTSWYWPPAVMRRVGQAYWQREIQHPGFVEQLFRHWLQHDVSVIARTLYELDPIAWKDLSDEQLWKKFQTFTASYNRLWREAIFIDAFDLESDPLLDEALTAEKHSLSPEDITILLTPSCPSWMMREERSLLALASRAKQTKALRQALLEGTNAARLQKRFPIFMKHVEQHAHEYFWTTNDYAIIRRRPLNEFLDQVRTFLRSPYVSQVTKTRRPRISPKTRRVVNFLATCSSWRDERKACSQMANDVWQHFLKEFSRRTGRDVADMEFSNYWELFSSQQVKAIPRNIQQKKKQWFSSGDPRNPATIFTGIEARKLRKVIEDQIVHRTELRGRPAVGGVVRGRVRIVLDQQDFPRFQQGDILVAPNTRPEYVSIMKLASAIVTEEGGVTSHAAIVSRELGTPAIVGVQGATSALRDGDRVEVDATTGIVRKI